MNQTQIKSLMGSMPLEGSVLFSSKDEQCNWFERLNQNSPMLKEIKMEAERFISENDPELTYSLFKLYEETGSRMEYQTIYFARRRRLNTFAIMLLLEPNHLQYRDALQNTIWSICDEYTWCLPAHLANNPETSSGHNFSLYQKTTRENLRVTIDLFSAETAFALSEILKLTEHLIDPLIGKRIHEEVYRRIFWPFQNGEFGWETATHNWASVCAGSIGSAAIHLIDDSEELAVVLERVVRTMTYYLEGFNDDGACLEGYGYWQYGFGYYVYFADLLKRKSSRKIDLFQSEKVHQIALFQQKSFLGEDMIVNFSDSVPKAQVFPGLSHYLHKLYPDVEIPEVELHTKYTDDHCSRWAPAIRNLLWFDERVEGQPWKEASYYLPDAQWLISRYSSMQGRFAFAAKGGHNAEPHNHNDIGQFMLYGKNELFLKDLGSGEYTSKYFGPERYNIVCNGSQGHSVPIINNQHQQAGKTFAAFNKEIVKEKEYEQWKLDISAAYDIASLKQLVRKFTWEKHGNPRLILEDYYIFSEHPGAIVERLITPNLLIEEDGNCVFLIGSAGQKLKIIFERNQLEFQQNKMYFRNHKGEKEAYMALDFIVKKLEKSCTIKLEFEFE
ncbi:hypothetical protein ACM26V_21395 [Salipaludibacillus sp. HK11]|uniref:hypothetical protein n=1 Tax=Salipaludibacillus sp. HK11 TaxID=3394320 RepID=UPI0039FBE773